MLSIVAVFFGVLGLPILFSFAPLLLSCLFSSEFYDADENALYFLQPVAIEADDVLCIDPLCS